MELGEVEGLRAVSPALVKAAILALTPEVDLSGKADIAATMGAMMHGGDPDVARPDYVRVAWAGTVEPNNAINGDTFDDLS